MSPATIQIILGILGSGGLLTAIAALRKQRVEARVDNDTATLAAMSVLNDRLNGDNLILRNEVKYLRDEVGVLREIVAEMPALKSRIAELEHSLEQARKRDK